MKWVGENKRTRRRWRGRDRESGQTCAVLLGHSSARGLSARLKDTLGFKREPWRFFLFFFYVYKNIFIYFSSLCHLSIYFLSSRHPLLRHWNRVRWRRHSRPPPRSPPPPPLSFNTAAVGNQTALKQIDVLFNIVVTTSQGPHAPALLTTAGLLSPAMAATLLVASMIYHKKREGDCESGKREKRGAMERKDPWITIESLAPLIDTV